MAEQPPTYDLAELRQATVEHQRGWEFFTRILVYAIGAVLVVLIGLLLFVA